MRLDAFRFRHVGPFGAEGVAVSGLRPGLNVLAEHNERGKSSLLAALETVLFLPHTKWRADKTARKLERTDGSPVGEIDFTHEGQSYRLTKRFIKSKYAELVDLKSGLTIAIKSEAEAKFRDILGYSSAVEDKGPSGLLWVRQGNSLDRAEDDGQVASRLESELSTLVGGDRARAYLARAEIELGELLNKNGSPKKHGPLALAEDALATTESELDAARAARDATRRLGEDLARVRERLHAAEAQGDPDTDAKALKEARSDLDRARLARSELDGLRERLARLESDAERARANLADHLEAIAALDAAQVQRTNLAADADAMRTREAETQTRLAALTQTLAELNRQRDALTRLERLRAVQERLTDRGAALRAVTANLEALDAERDRRAEQVAARDALPAITRDELDRMDRLERAIARMEGELASVDAALILDLVPDAAVTLGDRTVTSGPVRLSARQTLSIDGVGTIRLDAPEAKVLQARQDAARIELEAMRGDFGVRSHEEAVRIARDRQAISDTIAQIDAALDRIAPDGRDALADRHARLSDEIDTLAEQLEDAPDPEALEDAAQLDARLATARGEAQAAQTTLNAIAHDCARVEAERALVDRQIAAAPETAAPEKRDAFTAELSAAAASLDTQADTVRAALDTARAQAPTDPALIEARIQRLTDVARNRQDTLSRLRTEEAALAATRNQNFDDRDPEAEVTRLEEQAERQREDLERHRRRASALTLLRDTLRESQRALQDRYTEPVRRELLPLLRQVIDGADVALDESLGAQGLMRGGADDALERLSGGTREQIAVLTRLAFARLLAKGGQPCPVILDDALVYADDARRGRMFDVLNYVTAGEEGLQLLYLSCQEANADQLGGHRLHLETWPES